MMDVMVVFAANYDCRLELLLVVSQGKVTHTNRKRSTPFASLASPPGRIVRVLVEGSIVISCRGRDSASAAQMIIRQLPPTILRDVRRTVAGQSQHPHPTGCTELTRGK